MNSWKLNALRWLWFLIVVVTWHSWLLNDLGRNGGRYACGSPFFERRFLTPGGAEAAVEGPEGLEAEAVYAPNDTCSAALLLQPMLGRPTDRSITVNIVSRQDVEVFLEYGCESEEYAYSSGPFTVREKDHGIDLTIEGLKPNTEYHYRLSGRTLAHSAHVLTREGTFHTQRAVGDSFVVAIVSDSHQHLHNYGDPITTGALYTNTLRNITSDNPDFLIDLGDLIDGVRSIRTPIDPIRNYLEKRTYLDQIVHSIAYYLVLGNHESEHGWRIGGERPIAEWCTYARKIVIPNPFPNGFYSGNEDITTCCGLREDYYAWEWGDALFIVLDPFWYTTADPAVSGARDGWDWTLGREQYEWLYEILTRSESRWKLVFSHHMTGGLVPSNGPVSFYGRGGIEAAKHRVEGRPSFEWGGEDENGKSVFSEKRPGWDHGPVHDIMVDRGVDIFFHGHDHGFVYQTIDGIVYQECPRPNDISYDNTLVQRSGYSHGNKQPNSGHLRLFVDPESLRVDYVRSVLPRDQPLREGSRQVANREVTFSYTIHQ